MFDNIDLKGALEAKIDLFRVLTDPTRQEIILLFYGSKESCVNDIASHFTLSRPTISHHLQLMKRAGILQSRKEGKEVFYSFNKEFVLKELEELVDIIKAVC